MGMRSTMGVNLSQNGLTKRIVALLDTGADVTVISHSVWPPQWPLEWPTSTVAGVGGRPDPQMSKYPVQIKFTEEGQQVTLKGLCDALAGNFAGPYRPGCS